MENVQQNTHSQRPICFCDVRGLASLIVSSVRDVARKSILINVLIVALKVSRHEVNTTVGIDGDHNSC